jgi:hypothetical protein
MTKGLAIAAAALLAPPLGAAFAATSAEPYLALGLEELYDSNVQGSRGGDLVTRITPQLGILLRDPRFTLRVDYAVGIHAYAQAKADNSVNQIASLVGRAAATPRLDAETRIHFVDGDDPILLDRPGVAVPIGPFTDFVAQVGAAWRADRRLTLDLSYAYRRSRFGEASMPNPLAYDGDEHRVDADAIWRVTRRLSLRAIGRYDHFVAINAPNTLGDAVGGGGGFDYAFSDTTRARVQGGALQFTTAGATWFGTAELVHRGESNRWALRAIRDLFGGTGAYEAIWYESAMAEATFRLGRYLDVRVTAGAFRNGVAPDAPAYVNGILGHASVGWRTFRDAARFELYAEHRAQDATGGWDLGSLQRTLVGIRLVAAAGTDLTPLGDIP